MYKVGDKITYSDEYRPETFEYTITRVCKKTIIVKGNGYSFHIPYSKLKIITDAKT